jgi:hypothetical protein
VGVLVVAVVPLLAAVWTEATTPFGPNPGAHVIAPAGITVVSVVSDCVLPAWVLCAWPLAEMAALS